MHGSTEMCCPAICKRLSQNYIMDSGAELLHIPIASRRWVCTILLYHTLLVAVTGSSILICCPHGHIKKSLKCIFVFTVNFKCTPLLFSCLASLCVANSAEVFYQTSFSPFHFIFSNIFLSSLVYVLHT